MRGSAEDFFDLLERTHSGTLVIDFSGVRSISRSFAHEYLVRNQRSTKRITESNVPSNVTEMEAIIRNPSRREPLFSRESVRMIDV